MICELCGSEVSDSFGDVNGAIVCPKCMGWTGNKPDLEVITFLKAHGEWNDDSTDQKSQTIS